MIDRRTKVQRERDAAATQQLVDLFNRAAPVGTEVEVRRDGGEVQATKVRHRAWIEGGNAVVMLDGIAGWYLLSRVRVP